MSTAEPELRQAPTAAGSAAGTDGSMRPEGLALQLLLVAALAGAAAGGWLRLGDGRGPAMAVAVGAVAPPSLAFGASALRRRAWPGWAAGLGHLGLLAVLAAVVGGGPSAAASALSGGWARLLSTILPAPEGSEVEVLALAVAGAASAAGTELALRVRAAATPVVPAVVALVATRMATQGVADPRLTGPAVAVALLAGALVITRAGALRPDLGAPVALAAAVLAGVVGPNLPWTEARPPFDPRTLRHLPPIESAAVNPLARLRAWQLAPDRVLFRARRSESSSFRLTVLDAYDGTRFGGSARYAPAGAALPPVPTTDPGAGGPTRRVTAEVVIVGLDGPWVPAPDRPVRVLGPAVAADRVTAVVVAPGGVQPGQRYQVEAAVPAERLALLAGASAAGPDQVGEAAASVPPLPPAVAALATAAAGDPADPALTRLGRLQALFRDGFSEDPASPPGHSLARLSAFLDPADRVGSTEQLATGFAVLARSLGYPTRVVVGFQPPEGPEVEVRGADARAWPEVALAGVGWVAFDPTPPRGASTGAVRRPPESEAAAAAQAATTPTTQPPAGPAQPGPSPSAHGSTGRSWVPLGLGALALLVVALLPVGVAARKRRRRRARSGGSDPGARVRGAWAEATDRLLERGLARSPSTTPRDAARAVGAVSTAAGPPLADLGELAERAAFAGPGAVGPADADRAWADLDLVEAALAAEEGPMASFIRAVDPRPLVTRS